MHFYILTMNRSGTEIKNAILVKIAPNKILRRNLTKHVQDLYDEDYKILMKEIKEDLNTSRDIVFIDRKTQHNKDVNSL